MQDQLTALPHGVSGAHFPFSDPQRFRAWSTIVRKHNWLKRIANLPNIGMAALAYTIHTAQRAN